MDKEPVEQGRLAEWSADQQLSTTEVKALRDAFVAGFITGRTGSYHEEIAGISRRAAVTEFQRYSEHQYS
jgi:hypothetical protein